MRPKTFFILLGILCLLAGGGWVLFSMDDPSHPEKKMGGFLLKELPVNEVSLIRITGPKGSATLKRDDELWSVLERWNYPADFSMISDFMRRLREIKVGREFPVSDDVMGRIGLRDPRDKNIPDEEKAIRLEFEKSKGEMVSVLYLGKNREVDASRGQTGERYLMKEHEPVVYLVDWQVSGPSEEPFAWLQRDLLKVKGADVESIVCLAADGKDLKYSLARPGKGMPFELKVPGADEKISATKINRLSDTLSNLILADVSGPYDAGRPAEGFEGSVIMEYYLFDGLIYRIYPGGACGSDRCRIRVEVGFRPEAVQTEKGEGEQAKIVEERLREAQHLNRRLGSWVYIIPGWQHAAFVTDLERLFEKEDKKR